MTLLKSTIKRRAPVKSKRGKAERLSMRVGSFAKKRLQRAATYSHISVSEYVVARALEAAETDIIMHEKTILPETVWHDFFDALQKPPKQNAAMKILLKTHDQAVASR